MSVRQTGAYTPCFTDPIRQIYQHKLQAASAAFFFARLCCSHLSSERDTMITGMRPTRTMISEAIEAFSICAREASS